MYETTKRATESQLTAIAHSRVKEAAQISPEYVKLWQSIETVISCGGKRVRPYLTMVGYGKFDESVLPVALAQELIHIAMLIHDDVIDQDTIRHGQDNISGIYLKRYANSNLDEAQKLHYAYGASILAGDALLSEAYRLIHQAELSQAVTTRLVNRLHHSIYEVIGGELMDVETPILKTDTDPLNIYRYKTAGYSFIGPLISGATCAGASETTLRALELYGESVGIGFQLQDDLLGVFGIEAKTGKSTLTDLREAKATALIIAHKRLMNHDQKERFETIFGNDQATPEQLAELKQDLIDSGAKQTTERLSEAHFQKAVEAIQSLADIKQRDELAQFTNVLKNRQF